MKPSTFILPVLLTTVSFSGVDVKAEGQVFREQHCYENVENYIPGYYRANGRYVSAKVSNRRRKVACDHSDYSTASYSSHHSYGHSDIAHGYHSPHQQNNYYPQQQQQPIIINQPQNQCNGKIARMGLGSLLGAGAGYYAVGGKASSNTILGTVLGAGAGTLIGRATC